MVYHRIVPSPPKLAKSQCGTAENNQYSVSFFHHSLDLRPLPPHSNRTNRSRSGCHYRSVRHHLPRFLLSPERYPSLLQSPELRRIAIHHIFLQLRSHSGQRSDVLDVNLVHRCVFRGKEFAEPFRDANTRSGRTCSLRPPAPKSPAWLGRAFPDCLYGITKPHPVD